MKINITFTLITFFIMLSACKNEVTSEPINQHEEEQVAEDSLETNNPFVADTTKKAHEIKEAKENLSKIEKKYGEQWDFCQCVVANDSIDRAIKKMTDFESPEAEKLLERFEIVSTKCQAFLGMDGNRTPEERAKHEKKVKKCLKEAKNNLAKS